MTTTEDTRGRRAARSRRPVRPAKGLPGRRRTVRTPTVLQMEAVECGAASLAMVLGHYGRHVPLEELRIACGVSRDGSRASNLLKAARSYGLTAKGMQMDTAALAEVRAPAILFWEFNHYVVYDGMGRRLGRRGVYVNDPGKGRRFVPMEEFDTSFTGVVLVMEPGENFTRGGRRPGVLGALPARLRGTAGALPAAVLASLLLVAVGAAVPALSRTWIDTYLIGGQTSLLGVLFASMAACVVLTVVLTWLQQANLLHGRIVSSTLGSARFLRHLLRLPVTFFAQRSPADLVQRLQSNDQVAETLARDVAAAGVDAVVVVLYAVLLYAYDPQLTFVGIGVALLNVVAMRVVVRLRANRTAKLRADTARLTNTAYTGLQSIETLKATGGEDGYFRTWAGQHAITLEEQQRLGVPGAWLGVVAPTLATVNNALILWIGGMRAVEGHISVGLLVAFQALVARFTAPLTRLNGVAGRIQDFAADVARLKDVENFGADPLYTRPATGESTRRLHGHVELRNISFGYSPLDKPLLSGFDLRVGPGQQVALVGGSGSGKSTVSRLISGLYTPWDGVIRIDGQRLEDIPRGTLAASVSFVDQEVFLFEGTVRDNVALWDPSIPDDAVVEALRDAALYDVVMRRPGGIHSRVEQDGRNFSGGQRQRLEIARALVRRPSVLVLDEVTSALDAETEQVVMDNLRRRGCACVVIAHRLSTVRDSDEIVVLQHGTVVERGRHEELLALGGAYAALVRER
ncbi:MULTISPECIES: NHLP family bacteriocin export ABC transporter peptidase/permease/ATPase subunit [Streptomyces]|uniref:NHLP family bacteriocin export ABC transporter peptidase/permease/ATPase subunit n=1 Tax=Streptomyces thermoviolaceus subsp. thermoviolaceus TaxID=66860 RepID=A0ABX0YLZ2_STRTL|nr:MULTISPECIES: NHLP family bacteriocin export ABC transporter peptidase/permease/ATPase subunit [Streptomyces]NJP13543.1 NHLP family bacteriocin export ABC transporter peptidase/permease/ATPase subunit [Streptomyces thermoviolaceus subsp. thermoviolaceus]RSS03564.1 NHLP family bacteriocin export ABC transporter peptidase/permease/ATPase subunit [Streptomyces sp. WAC00469]WTD46297.1 NHLP family bacteriocin export ABC transporter peptidase/permease/ATPase subunit [Streptomyces thermoviolaceus]G